MDKPLSLKRRDFLAAIIAAINESNLPPCVAFEVLRGVTVEVENLAKKQEDADAAEWAKAQKEGESGD